MKLRYMAVLPVAMIALWANQANAASVEGAKEPLLQPGYHQMAAQASEEDIKKAETKDFRYRYHHNQPMMAEGILAPKTDVHPYHHEGMMTEGMMHHPDDRKLCDGERTRKAPATAEEKEQRKKALAADYQRRK
ncbi:hypothetical protein [uncultured Veillonella sp.]|uniref:hypothetical protein n=1 Tax=uncultured Veillonella sp. TaxID=159268 RepID=UPI00259819E1|nr:hypothetical protein [uncultured Veillonella sp.]